eukprot:403357879
MQSMYDRNSFNNFIQRQASRIKDPESLEISMRKCLKELKIIMQMTTSLKAQCTKVSFVLLLNNDYEVETFFIVTISSLLFYGMFIWIYKAKYTVSGMINDIKTAVFLASTLLFLTPVLKSLTVAYSTDTIIILVVFFILLHLFLYDYQMIKKPLQLENITQSIGSPTSLNAIFFATILLASRLQKMRQVYVLLFESIILFGFFPLFRQGLRSYSILVSDILSVITSLANFLIIIQFSGLFAFCYATFVIFVTMISPQIFIYAYQFKNDIQGPWDLPKVMQYTTIE